MVPTAAAAPTPRETPHTALAHWNLDPPFNFTDLYPKTDAARFPSQVDCSQYFPNCDSPRFATINYFFRAHNISDDQRWAAMVTEDPMTPTELSDAQVDAVVAADETLFDPTASPNQDTEREDNAPHEAHQDKRHIKHIYQTLNANFSLPEIHELFHDENGVPIMLSDKEVDAAIAAHNAEVSRA